MTFDELVSGVADRLNLTSADAITRIGQRVNERYRRVTSSAGLNTTRFQNPTFTVNTTTFPQLPDMRIDMETVVKVRKLATSPTVRVLRPITHDEMDEIPTRTGLPEKWAIKSNGPSHTIITLDGFPDTDSFTLSVEGYKNCSTLASNDEPLFPEDFHDILTFGAMADELMKMEKPQLAAEREAQFGARLSDLKFFIAKMIYQDIYAGKKSQNQWYWPWAMRQG